MDAETVVPQDAEAAKQLLDSMGVQYDDRVVEQLMDFAYRYTGEVLQDAAAVSARCGLPPGQVAAPDVMLAIQARAEHAFVPPPPQGLLLSLAETRNADPLPPLRSRHGLRLPPEGECLLNPNFQVQAGEREPLVPPAEGIEAVAKAARQQSGFNVDRRGTMKVAAPGAGWAPGEDAPGEPWPGSGGGDDAMEEEQL